MRGEGGGLPSIVGIAAPGEWSDGRHFDGSTEMAFFPGDLPARRARTGRRLPLDPVPAARAGRNRRRHSRAAPHSPRPRAAIPDRGPAAMTETLRKPAIFSVDDPRLVVAAPDEAQRAERRRRRGGAGRESFRPCRARRRRRMPWGALFWSALSGLVLLALGLGGHEPDRGSVRARALARRGRAGAGAARRPGAAGGDARARSSASRGSPRSSRCAIARSRSSTATTATAAARWSPTCCR